MSRTRTGNFEIHDFYCVQCAHKIPLPRATGQFRESSHLKNLYCPNCKKEINHVEINPGSGKYTYEDFLLERELGRFVGDVRVPYNQLASCTADCKFNVDGKCWNATKSFNCGHR